MVELRILSEDDKNLIHGESLKVLSQAGINLESREALDMLKSKGCIVDYESCIVKFPTDIVESALKTAPKKFTLGGLDPNNDMFLGEGNTYVCTDGQACFVYDTEKGERRETVMKDLVEAARLVDALDYIQLHWPIVSAGDVPVETRILHELVQGYRVMGKHYQTDCFSAVHAKFIIKVLETILGSREKVIERKIFSSCCCPVSPLIYEAEMVEGNLALAEIEAPILILPMPISGTTAPMSLFGTVIQNNAEVLAGLTIYQLNHPGTPIIYGSAAGILDMKSTLFCTGSPEGALQNAACAEMAKYYGLPSLTSTNATEAKAPDIHAGREKAASLVTCAMAAPDILCGVGLVDTSNLYYPELLVLDEDSIGYGRRIAAGIRGGEENALTGVTLSIGPGGNYLKDKSTRAYLRNGEHYHPVASVRQGFEAWETSEDADVRAAARKKVAAILAAPEKVYLPEDIMGKLELLLVESEKELCES